VPDPRIGLTAKGWQDAEDCERCLRDVFSSDSGQAADDWKVYFYVSPYHRTLETLRGIGRAIEDPRRIAAGVNEDARLREQDFGNFQERDKMRVEKETRLRYGRFFYRFPDGEPAADVNNRITGFRQTLRADIDIGRFQLPAARRAGQRSQHMNVVIVPTRPHFPRLPRDVVQLDRATVRGPQQLGNGGTLVMQTGQGGRYSLLVHHTVDQLREFDLTDQMLHE
jgi:hypothetical protein